ncbi:MAG: AAA family ATPase [Deltaproteobacteria bacterium]|nr:AAA family ATPase [Deltaproteobacteria bacterium]
MELTSCQSAAMDLLNGADNVFLTGQAGTGKSFLIDRFRRETKLRYPVLASTGAAAVIVGGRTFHSYFGLGILEGGPAATINKAIRNSKVRKRLNAADGIILDEVSMIPGVALSTAEAIARFVRDRNDVPWGGLRIIAVGDFFQLPPITRDRTAERDWAFKGQTWAQSRFRPSILDTVMRTSDPDFLEVLNRVRIGQCDELVTDFLNSRDIAPPESLDLTRLFPFRETTELHNLERLQNLEGKEVSFPTIYTGPDNFVTMLRNSAPIPQALRIKPDALVMLRHNDPKGPLGQRLHRTRAPDHHLAAAHRAAGWLYRRARAAKF